MPSVNARKILFGTQLTYLSTGGFYYLGGYFLRYPKIYTNLSIEQRNKGVNGPKYLVLSHLINKNKGKYTNKKAVWNKSFNRWVPDTWFTSSCEYRSKRIYEDPEWEYSVLNVKKVTHKQVNFIKEHENKIIHKISKNKKPRLEYFQF